MSPSTPKLHCRMGHHMMGRQKHYRERFEVEYHAVGEEHEHDDDKGELLTSVMKYVTYFLRLLNTLSSVQSSTSSDTIEGQKPQTRFISPPLLLRQGLLYSTTQYHVHFCCCPFAQPSVSFFNFSRYSSVDFVSSRSALTCCTHEWMVSHIDTTVLIVFC